MEEVKLSVKSEKTLELHEEGEQEEILREFVKAREDNPMQPISIESQELDAAFDLKVMRPQAVDLKKLWDLTGLAVPRELVTKLGPRVPILLNHMVTPFPAPGTFPGGVWALGYEFVPQDLNADTVAVLPNDEALRVAKVSQSVDLALSLGGEVRVPEVPLDLLVPGVSLQGASLRTATSQGFQFAVKLEISLRKVIGGPSGAGGATWQMYRQDEPLDRSHALLQVLLVEPGTTAIRCKVKTWASQAGWLGTRIGATLYTYPDCEFDISLAGLQAE